MAGGKELKESFGQLAWWWCGGSGTQCAGALTPAVPPPTRLVSAAVAAVLASLSTLTEGAVVPRLALPTSLWAVPPAARAVGAISTLSMLGILAAPVA